MEDKNIQDVDIEEVPKEFQEEIMEQVKKNGEEYKKTILKHLARAGKQFEKHFKPTDALVSGFTKDKVVLDLQIKSEDGGLRIYMSSPKVDADKEKVLFDAFLQAKWEQKKLKEKEEENEHTE